jgi:hypothetical protein
MSQNLDPDAIDKLNESFRELNHSMPSFILGINQILGVASGSVKASDALKNLSKSTKELTAMQEAQAQTDEKMDAIRANRTNAEKQATESLRKFALGLTSTTTEFSTFGKAVSGAGDAALAWGKNLGLLGLTIGVLIKATTLAAEAAMKQADNVLKAKDELSKMGVAGGMTAKSLLEMGHAAGYSSEKLGVIVKASRSMGTDIMALGGNVKQSMKESKVKESSLFFYREKEVATQTCVLPRSLLILCIILYSPSYLLEHLLNRLVGRLHCLNKMLGIRAITLFRIAI